MDVRASRDARDPKGAPIPPLPGQYRLLGATSFVTTFTFQAPGFYQRLGYEEIFRWESVPTPGRDDVHMRKEV